MKSFWTVSKLANNEKRYYNSLSKIRRLSPQDIVRQIGIIINDDGSVFDPKIKKKFNTVVEWSREMA